RNADPGLAARLQSLSAKRKALIQDAEVLKSQRNAVSKEIGALKAKAKSDPVAEKEAEAKVLAMREVGDRIKKADEELAGIEAELRGVAYQIPNLPHASVPDGKDADGNLEVRTWGKKPEFSFTPKEHVEIGEGLGILDFERATKLSGARFSLYL